MNWTREESIHRDFYLHSSIKKKSIIDKENLAVKANGSLFHNKLIDIEFNSNYISKNIIGNVTSPFPKNKLLYNQEITKSNEIIFCKLNMNNKIDEVYNEFDNKIKNELDSDSDLKLIEKAKEFKIDDDIVNNKTDIKNVKENLYSNSNSNENNLSMLLENHKINSNDLNVCDKNVNSIQ